jgi:hypothetical protein
VKSTDRSKIDGEIVDGDEQCIGIRGEATVFIRRNRDPGKFWDMRLSTPTGDLVLPAPEMNRVISLLTTACSIANQQRFDPKQEGATNNTLRAICEEYIKGDGKSLRSVGWRERVFMRWSIQRLVPSRLATLSGRTSSGCSTRSKTKTGRRAKYHLTVH